MTHDEARDLAAAYVLGALEADEERLVAEHLASCPEDHSEFAELGSVVPYLDETVPLVEPPAALRDRILVAAAGDLANRGSGSRARVGGAPPAPGPGAGRAGRADRPTDSIPQRGRVVGLDEAASRRRADRGSWVLGIAAVLAIVVLGGLTIVTQQQLTAARDFQARTNEVLRLASQPGAQVAVLTPGQAGGPSGIAVLPQAGPGRLVMSGLAATTGGQVYEAWAIAEGSPPVPVGAFTVGADGSGYLDRMPSASGQPVTVAITLEARHDPPAPTTPVLSSGVTVPSGATS